MDALVVVVTSPFLLAHLTDVLFSPNPIARWETHMVPRFPIVTIRLRLLYHKRSSVLLILMGNSPN